ncbi:MAG: hypothetical protein OXC93_05020 [Rhodospirillaceae bacterium]|nr:hypothetical protein [Rhodospirillaceae bacterium]
MVPENLTDLLRGHEHPGFIAGKALKSEVFVMALTPGKSIRVITSSKVA